MSYDAIIDVVSWAALIGGSFFFIVGAIGLNRMPDVFTRMHATSVSDTLGVGLLVFGMIAQAGPTLVAVKLIMILLVLYLTGPVASHALAYAALHDKMEPLIADEDGTLSPTPEEQAIITVEEFTLGLTRQPKAKQKRRTKERKSSKKH